MPDHTPSQNTRDRHEAARVLRRYAQLVDDPGEKGYCLGIAERYELEPGLTVRPGYLEQLRDRVSDLERQR